MSGHAQSPAELESHLRDQLAFLRASATAFDEGHESEAKRLAVTIRVLLHDTAHSISLLEQLGIKSRLRYMDTAIPVSPHNLLTTAGLTMMVLTAGGDNPGGRYAAPLEMLSPERQNNPPKSFDEWWLTPVVKDDGALFDRRGLVLALAHQDGGAHVDPDVDAAYAALSRSNSLGWVVDQPGGTKPMPNPVPASVRQIAFELERTLEKQLPSLLVTGSRLERL